MESKYVKVTKDGVTKKIDKKLVKDYVSAGWVVDNTPNVNTYTKYPYNQSK